MIKCPFCNYSWKKRKKNPKCCPKCKRPLNIFRKDFGFGKCKECGYKWKLRKKLEDVKECPNCKRRNFR